MLFLVQVPLIHAHQGALGGAVPNAPPPMAAAPQGAPSKKAAEPEASAADKSDVEQAVLGHGPNLGPYNEGRGLRLVRDPKFPVRVTVQFYKATSNGIVSDQDLAAVNESISKVYANGDYVGSLVVPERDRPRPTMWKRPATAVGFWRW